MLEAVSAVAGSAFLKHRGRGASGGGGSAGWCRRGKISSATFTRKAARRCRVYTTYAFSIQTNVGIIRPRRISGLIKLLRAVLHFGGRTESSLLLFPIRNYDEEE